MTDVIRRGCASKLSSCTARSAPNALFKSRDLDHGAGLPPGAQGPPQKAAQAVGQEHHEDDEDDAQHDQVPFGVAADHGFEERDDDAAHQRADQRADAADQRHHHGLGGNLEAEEMRRHEAAQHRIDQSAERGDLRRHDVGGELVPERVVAEIRNAIRIVANGAQARCRTRVFKNAPRTDIDDADHAEHEIVEHEIVGEVDLEAGEQRNVSGSECRSIRRSRRSRACCG